MSIQSNINQMLGMGAAAAYASGIPQEKRAIHVAERNVTKAEQAVTEASKLPMTPEEYEQTDPKLMTKNVATLKEAESQYTAATKHLSELDPSYKNIKQSARSKFDKPDMVIKAEPEEIEEELRAEEANKKAEQRKQNKLNRNAEISKAVYKAQLSGREDLSASGLSGEAYDIAAKQSDKQIKARVLKQYKGLRGVGKY